MDNLRNDQTPGVLPVHQHQVISQQSAAAFRPEHFNQTARVQSGIHVESMSQLVHRLRRRRRRTRRKRRRRRSYHWVSSFKHRITERNSRHFMKSSAQFHLTLDFPTCRTVPLTPLCLSYSDAPPLIGRLSGEVSLISIRSFDSQEAVGGVTDAAG